MGRGLLRSQPFKLYPHQSPLQLLKKQRKSNPKNTRKKSIRRITDSNGCFPRRRKYSDPLKNATNDKQIVPNSHNRLRRHVDRRRLHFDGVLSVRSLFDWTLGTPIQVYTFGAGVRLGEHEKAPCGT